MKIEKFLKGVNSVAIDTAPFIYYIEENKKYLKSLDKLFTKISEGAISAYTSYITLIEVLTKPVEKDDNELIGKYENLLENSENLFLCEINREIAVMSAKIRAKYAHKVIVLSITAI